MVFSEFTREKHLKNGGKPLNSFLIQNLTQSTVLQIRINMKTCASFSETQGYGWDLTPVELPSFLGISGAIESRNVFLNYWSWVGGVGGECMWENILAPHLQLRIPGHKILDGFTRHFKSCNFPCDLSVTTDEYKNIRVTTWQETRKVLLKTYNALELGHLKSANLVSV